MTAFRMPQLNGDGFGDGGSGSGGNATAVADHDHGENTTSDLDSLLGNDAPALSIHQPEAEVDNALWTGNDYEIDTAGSHGGDLDPDATPPDNGDDASDAPELGDQEEEDMYDAVAKHRKSIGLDPLTGEPIPPPPADELPPGSVTEAFQEAANVEAETPITVAETVAADSAPTTPIIDDWFRDQFAKIHNAELDCMRAESTLEDLKQQAKEAKEHLEGCVIKLRALCREARQEQEREKDGGYPLLSGSATATAGEPGPQADALTITDDDSWRSVTLDYLDIPARIVQSLLEATINTLGDLADFTTSGKKLTEIKGIGKAAAEKITEAAEDYHRERLASQGATEVEAVEPTIDEVADAVVAEMNEQLEGDSAPIDSDHTTDVDLLDSNGPGSPPVDWREVSCEHLSITEAVLGKVYRQGLETLGDLADWLADQRNDVATIGGKKAGEKIVAAFDELRAKYVGVAGYDDQADQVEQPAAAAATAPQSIGDDILE